MLALTKFALLQASLPSRIVWELRASLYIEPGYRRQARRVHNSLAPRYVCVTSQLRHYIPE
jgi:hypothetical protein